jgi:hypothetical protein
MCTVDNRSSLLSQIPGRYAAYNLDNSVASFYLVTGRCMVSLASTPPPGSLAKTFERICNEYYQRLTMILSDNIMTRCEACLRTERDYTIPRVPECLYLRPNCLTHPLSRKRVCPPPPGTKGGVGTTLACV